MKPRAEWLEATKRRHIGEIARALGIPSDEKYGARCPACNKSRPVDRSGRPVHFGANGLGFPNSGFFTCFACGASGDQVDIVALALEGQRYSKLPETGRARVRAWCTNYTGVSTQSASPTIAGTGTARATTNTPTFTLAPPDDREPEAPRYPPVAELNKLWRATARCDVVPVVADWLRRVRNIDATRVADENLARALVRDVSELDFARIGRWRWFALAYVLLLRLVDHLGYPRSIIARCVRPPRDPKSASPSGFQRKGLVLANSLGVRMLRHGVHPSQWPAANSSNDPFPLDEPWWPSNEIFRAILCEGECDYLAWATSSAWGDANPYAPAVFGFVQGAWKREHAARVPRGTHITISQQPGTQGLKYTQSILETLRGRSDVEVSVWSAPSVPEDL